MYDKIYDMYANIGLGSCDVCQECSSNKWWDLESAGRIGPVPIYYIGRDYVNQDKKIVFVGSAGYGWDEHLPKRTIDYKNLGKDQRSTLICKMEEAHDWLLNDDKQISIYRVLRKFLKKYYSNLDATSNICLTNIVHCNKGNISYSFPADIRFHCAHEQANLTVTKKEIEILRPDIIVGLCTTKDRYYIDEWQFSWPVKKVCYGHPSRKNIEAYVDDILKQIED